MSRQKFTNGHRSLPLAVDFKLDPQLMSLPMLKEVAEWIEEHCSSGAAPAFSAEGLVYRVEDEEEAQAFRERWLLNRVA